MGDRVGDLERRADTADGRITNLLDSVEGLETREVDIDDVNALRDRVEKLEQERDARMAPGVTS